MFGRNILSKWTNEFCSPVVLVLATAEAENISLKNGLLFHHLLSAFGHLDAINCSIRAGNTLVSLENAHIRFERITEVKSKNTASIEEVLRTSFEEYNIARLPTSVAELKNSPPTSWTGKLEQIFLHSLSYSEFEMISHPVILLSVVASTDLDPVAAMQELTTPHYLPQGLSSGQYDPEIHRVYLILHDNVDGQAINPAITHRQMQLKFPPNHTKLLRINSLPIDAQNLHQPDMWSRSITPLFYPAHAPALDPSTPRPLNPVDGQPVLGSCLSIEDFMTLREFCVGLYHQEVIPSLEKRLIYLTKVVNDNRKGTRNMLKNMFLRKPREETVGRGIVKYRFDRIESQLLLLADTFFLIQDYESALSNYKLAKDDFKSDKSALHFMHTCLMIAACTMLIDPGKTRDLCTQLDQVVSNFSGLQEPSHAAAYFAFLTSEMFTTNGLRMHREAAHLLLQASSSNHRFTLLSSMLVERAAMHFLHSGQRARFVLYQVVAARQMKDCGSAPARHASVCYAVAMIIHDKGRWGDIKSRLLKALSKDLMKQGPEGGRRALVLMLKMIRSVFSEEEVNIGGRAAVENALAELRSIMNPGAWGSVVVGEGWADCLTHEILLNAIPVLPIDRQVSELPLALTPSPSPPWTVGDPLATLPNSSYSSDSLSPSPLALHSSSSPSSSLPIISSEITGFSIPEINKKTIFLLCPLNGLREMISRNDLTPSSRSPPSSFSSSSSSSSTSCSVISLAEEMKIAFEFERKWIEDQSMINDLNSLSHSNHISSSNHPNKNQSSQLWQDPHQAHLYLRHFTLAWAKAEVDYAFKCEKYGIGKILDLGGMFSVDPLTYSSQTLQTYLSVPLGEKVCVKFQFFNRLPVDITLTDLQLELDPPLPPSSTSSLSLRIGARQVKDVLLSALPQSRGSYRVRALQWNLSDVLRIRQPIHLEGPLLQKTLKQRMEKIRKEDDSLLFQVVDPYPLLTLSFEGISTQVLQGQLLKATLLLRNDGQAPAHDIHLKLSQPSFVFILPPNSISPPPDTSSEFKIESNLEFLSSSSSSPSSPPSTSPLVLESCGSSLSLIRLPPDCVVPPGHTLRLGAWLNMNEFGTHLVSVLASYRTYSPSPSSSSSSLSPSLHSSSEFISISSHPSPLPLPFGKNDFRTSFISVETCVLPSVAFQVRSVNRSSSLEKRMFVIEMNNFFLSPEETLYSSSPSPPSSPSSTSSSTFSFTAPLDHNEGPTSKSPSHSLDLEEGNCRIEGIWVLGCGQASSSSSSSNFSSLPTCPSSSLPTSTPAPSVKAAPLLYPPSKLTCPSSQKLILCLPGEIAPSQINPQSQQASIPGRKSWILPLSLDQSQLIESSSSNGQQQASELTQIIERFLCISTANQVLQRHLLHSRELAQNETNEETTGPRTISQVRRDNREQSATPTPPTPSPNIPATTIAEETTLDPADFISLSLNHKKHKKKKSKKLTPSRRRSRSSSTSSTSSAATSPRLPPLFSDISLNENEDEDTDGLNKDGEDEDDLEEEEDEEEEEEEEEFSGSNGGVLSANELALSEAKRGQATFVVVWSYKWQGRRKLGMSALPHINILSSLSKPLLPLPSLPTPSPLPTAVSSSSSTPPSIPLPPLSSASPLSPLHALRFLPSQAPADYLLASLSFPNRIYFPTHASSGASASNTPSHNEKNESIDLERASSLSSLASLQEDQGVYAGIKLRLRSLSPLPLLLSVEAIEKRDRSLISSHLLAFSGSATPNTSSSTTPSNSTPLPQTLNATEQALFFSAVSKSSSRGVSWCSKTKYHHLVLLPHSTLHLPFQVHFSTPGIFDLKRFVIHASFAQPHPLQPSLFLPISSPLDQSLKPIIGQCLIEVLPPPPPHPSPLPSEIEVGEEN